MPREYKAYRTARGCYEVWITIRTTNGDEMHFVKGNIKSIKKARETARLFNSEIGVE